MPRQRKPNVEVLRLTARLHRAGYTNRFIATQLGVCDRTLYRWAAGKSDIRLVDYQRLVGLLTAVEEGRAPQPPAQPQRSRKTDTRKAAVRPSDSWASDSWGELVAGLS